MRDPAGELSDCLHLLRLGKLDLEVLLLGDVDKMQGKPTPPVKTGGRCVSLDIVDPAEEQNNYPFARAGDSDLDRIAFAAPISRRRKLRGDTVAVFLVYQTDQLLPNQIPRCSAEQLTERAVRLFETTRTVEQRAADRRVGEKTLKPACQSERSVPLPLRCQVAHHRARAQFGARSDDALSNPSWNDAALASFEQYFPALRTIAPTTEGIGGVRLSSWLRGYEIVQDRPACEEFCGGGAEPSCQRLVDKTQTTIAIDGVEADRCIIKNVDQFISLIADRRFDFVAFSNISYIQKAVSEAASNRTC